MRIVSDVCNLWSCIENVSARRESKKQVVIIHAMLMSVLFRDEDALGREFRKSEPHPRWQDASLVETRSMSENID